MDDILSSLKNFLRSKIKIPSTTWKFDNSKIQPTEVQAAQRAIEQPSVAPLSNDQEIERKIRAGFREYNKGQELPMEKYIPQLLEATKRYDIFKKYPYLIPAVSLNETSGGKNYTNLKNPVSWGARIKDVYQPQSPEQAIEDMMTAVGGDPNRGAGFDPKTAANRMRTAEYYRKFRESGDLKDFSETFEPATNNPEYYQNLINFIQMFERQ